MTRNSGAISLTWAWCAIWSWKMVRWRSLNGYLGPEDFRVFLRLGVAAYLIPRGKYGETIALMEDRVAKFPDNPRAATLLFTRGMAEYLTGRDKVAFYETMSVIRARYPDSLEARTWPFMEA